MDGGTGNSSKPSFPDPCKSRISIIATLLPFGSFRFFNIAISY
jgi:hypothetical protein